MSEAIKSIMVHVRLNEVIKVEAEKKASSLGYLKPSGEPNLSEYIRNLIITDLKQK